MENQIRNKTTYHEEVLERVEGEFPSGSREREVMRCGGSAGCGGAAAAGCCPDHLPDMRARHSSCNHTRVISPEYLIAGYRTHCFCISL